ncbi:DUF932 domain-containing protein [Terrabacter sp. MAHUQ-38]|uniref:DUF932 domain-containing protein n=1 Tax=unclassified Terrabacter TaxID=2630222 RepID=UPI00165E8CC5|nr:DUF932 domain-containing protein [Terrabacter sp. MAHUQ-38]MBC9820505.1 DUF932 domain-containing protein [Terrabacter sp. MAHUQ-38]
MSAESMSWLNRNVLIGFTEKRGTAWHYRKSDQGSEPNHYTGPIPVEEVNRRLFAWDPVAVDVYADTGGLISTKAEGYKAITRSDNLEVLGIVSSSYEIHPYRAWLLDRISDLVGPDLGIGSAGLLKQGARAWVQVEVPETISTPEGVAFRPFLTATSSLDGRSSTTYLTGAQVVVCDNTLNAALKDEDAAKLRIRHTKHSQFDVDDVRDALQLLELTTTRFSQQVRAQCHTKVTDEHWLQFLEAHFPLKNPERFRTHRNLAARSAVYELWRTDRRVAPWRNTAYGVVAAINTYQHHVAPAKRTDPRSRAERNALRATSGGFEDIDDKTLRSLATVGVTVKEGLPA